MRKKIIGNLLLLLSAMIWGSAFVAQSVGMEYIGPLTFNASRSLLGGITLLPVVFLLSRQKKPSPQTRKATWQGGLLCGAVLFFASTLQQVGIQYTTVGKASFITTLYIIIVPVLGLLFKKRVPFLVWVAVAFSTIGLYLLCIQENFTIDKGDQLILGCAFLFSIHILVIDRFAGKADAIAMSCIQFFVAGVLSSLCALLFETVSISALRSTWVTIAYAGILSSGVAYTLQVVAQKDTDPTVASLLLSLESIFGALSAILFLGESFTLKEGVGMLCMLCGVILAQLPPSGMKEKA